MSCCVVVAYSSTQNSKHKTQLRHQSAVISQRTSGSSRQQAADIRHPSRISTRLRGRGGEGGGGVDSKTEDEQSRVTTPRHNLTLKTAVSGHTKQCRGQVRTLVLYCTRSALLNSRAGQRRPRSVHPSRFPSQVLLLAGRHSFIPIHTYMHACSMQPFKTLSDSFRD